MPPIEIGTVAFPQPGRGAAAAAEADDSPGVAAAVS